MFRRRFGFTMVEVIVSLAIFVGCLASVLSCYNLLSRPYIGVYDEARKLIADIENCAVHFDEIIKGNNGIDKKSGKMVKSLLVDGNFDVSFARSKKGSDGSWWSAVNIMRVLGDIWSDKKDIFVFENKIKFLGMGDLKIIGDRKSIRLCQFSIDNHPILDAAKRRYGADNVVMKNVYFYSFKDTPESLFSKLGFR